MLPRGGLPNFNVHSKVRVAWANSPPRTLCAEGRRRNVVPGVSRKWGACGRTNTHSRLTCHSSPGAGPYVVIGVSGALTSMVLGFSCNRIETNLALSSLRCASPHTTETPEIEKLTASALLTRRSAIR